MTVTAFRAVSAAPAARRIPLISREHGANLMAVHALLLGLVAGIAAGNASWAGGLVALVFVLVFLPFGAAVSSLSRRPARRQAQRRIAYLSIGMAATGAVALAIGPVVELLAVGVATAALAGSYAAARQASGPRSVLAELLAIASISLFAPLTWLLVSGPAPAWELSAPVAFLAFGGTVPYVRERVHRRKETGLTLVVRLRRGATAVGWQAGALVFAVVATSLGSATWLLPVAFVPGAVKTVAGLAAPERRPPIKRIGILETVVSTVFAILAGIALGA